jgi:hypothetical protein
MLVRSIAIAALLTFATAARADWEGDVEMKGAMGRHGGSAPTGKVRFKDGKMRMDMQMGPMEMSTIVDFPSHKVLLINHGAKAYSEMNGDRPGMGGGPNEALPHCKTLKFEACMKEQGFKKAGSDTINGVAATAWEGEREGRHGKRHEKIWHPDAAGDEFAFVRIESGEGERHLDVQNFKMAKQDAAAFEAPEGYAKGEGFPGMMGPGMGGPGGPHGKGRPPMHPGAEAPPPAPESD